MTSTNQSNPNTSSFADLGLSEEVLAAVADMGYTAPTPVQAAAIPHALDGEDVLAAAQTGTGKTAAFLLPTMNNLPRVPRSRGRKRDGAQGPLMLVVTPTRELAQQIEAVCTAIARRTGHSSVTVVGGVSYNPQKEKLRRGCDILIATPGRLEDLIAQEACMLDQVQVLVLDEADRMLDMGFLPAVRRIVRQTRDDRQTLLFSATLDESQVGSITDLVTDPARVEIAPVTSTADTVEQFVLPVALDAKNALLASVLKREGASRAIVFCRTKHRADACSRRLARAGITCAAIHGDRSQGQRERALRAFRADECDVLVATDVLARGIDISDVRYVVNFDVPSDPVDYIHRIGRTGRAGEEGWSLTFVTHDDIDEFFDIEALMGKTAELFDAEGLELGADAPQIDPDRVPAKAPAGKKEKKRRKKAAERRRGGEGPARGGAASKKDAGVEAAAEGSGSKPSRRKRGGKTRVHAEEGADFELLSAGEARRARAERDGDAERSSGRRRGGKRPADDTAPSTPKGREGGSARGRGKGGSRGGLVNGRKVDEAAGRSRSRQREDVASALSHGGREAWRNYDEAPERRGRGGRGGQAAGTRSGRSGGRDNRSGYGAAGRGGNGRGASTRSGRRPGDRGGRR